MQKHSKYALFMAWLGIFLLGFMTISSQSSLGLTQNREAKQKALVYHSQLNQSGYFDANNSSPITALDDFEIEDETGDEKINFISAIGFQSLFVNYHTKGRADLIPSKTTYNCFSRVFCSYQKIPAYIIFKQLKTHLV